MSTAGDPGIRVLHVDDDPDLAAVVALHLERVHDDISVVTETGARDGLDRLDADGETVDCVVSDHDMPGMDGLDFLRAVRADYPDLPFVLFTGKGSEEIASEAISAGVTEYLQKGTGSDQYTVLANRIERAVEEERAKEALEESERVLSTLISNLPGLVYRCRNEPGWPMEFVSEGCEELTGYDPAVIESEAVSWGEDVVASSDRDELWNRVQDGLQTGEAFEVNYRIVTADGETRWVWERGSGVYDDGELRALEGFITDITTRRERERELENQREFVESLLDALSDGFCLIDTDGAMLRWNDLVPEITGYSEEELASMNAADIVADEDVPAMRAAIERIVEEGIGAVDLTLVTNEGDRIPIEFRGTVVRDSVGDIVGIAGIARDVTDCRERQQELELYETVVNAVGDTVYALDAEGTPTFVNHAIEDLTGHSPEDLVGEHVSTILDEAAVQEGRDRIQELLRSEDRTQTTFEMDLLTEDDGRVPTENHFGLLPLDDGEFRGTAGIIRDITERKRRERRLEEFASAVSHDLRSPLNVIMGRVDLARETGSDAHLVAIEDAAAQMDGLIEDLLDLARKGRTVGETSRVALDSVAMDAWRTVSTDTATVDIDALDTVDVDEDRVRKLFENLFNNAIDHGGPEVTIRVTDTPAGFAVADDGPGIPPSERQDVFRYGYTNSQDGTGFGLSIVERIADAHGWSVSITESDAGGARFEFTT